MRNLVIAGKKGGSAHKHSWTDEERAIIRRDYKGTIKSAEQIARHISYLTRERITLCAVKGQIANMGISFSRGKPWMQSEIEKLSNLITQYPIYRIAKLMKRSKNSIRVKATRLGLSTAVRDGWFTKKEVCQILGVDHKKVQRWIDSGELIARWHTDTKPSKNGMAMWHIKTLDLRDFIISHASELVGRNVDLFIIIEILVGFRSKP